MPVDLCRKLIDLVAKQIRNNHIVPNSMLGDARTSETVLWLTALILHLH